MTGIQTTAERLKTFFFSRSRRTIDLSRYWRYCKIHVMAQCHTGDDYDTGIPPTPSRGPLINTSVFRHRTLFSRSLKSRFNTSDCCLTTSSAPVWMTRDFTVGCSAVISRIFSEISDTISLVKQSTLVFLLKKCFVLFTAPSPTISVWGPSG